MLCLHTCICAVDVLCVCACVHACVYVCGVFVCGGGVFVCVRACVGGREGGGGGGGE